MPSVLNKYTATPAQKAAAVNIMRPSKWGNPFVIGATGPHGRPLTRDQVISQHEDWLLGSDRGQALLAQIGELRGKDLLCCCAPKACHGDLLLRLANNLAGPL